MLSYTHNKLIFLVTKVISMILENKWRKFMFIQNITCEFVKEPISIDCQHPRFSWEIDAEKNNVFQTAWMKRT